VAAPALPAHRPFLVEALIAAVLLASIHGFMSIPFMAPLGADLHNLYAFHQCAARDAPYAATGFACGDVAGRDMYYPPALYWLFAWVRPLTPEGATAVWTVVVALGTFASVLAFAPASRWRSDGRLGLFAGLLVVSHPLLFSLERANNDVLVLLGFAGALVAWRAGRAALAGGALGVACVLKLYPALAAASLGLAVVAEAVARPERRRPAVRFALAGAAAVALPTLLLRSDTVDWVTHRLLPFADVIWIASSFNHALVSTVGPSKATGMAAVVLAAWAVAAVRNWRDDPALAFAGTLAASTSLARTSFDYNLITALPLLLVQFQRATAGGRWRPAVDAALVAGLAAVAGHRGLVASSPALIDGKVLLLWAWLLASAALAAWRPTPAAEAWEAPAPGDARGQAA
jgi:hypothetical protein